MKTEALTLGFKPWVIIILIMVVVVVIVVVVLTPNDKIVYWLNKLNSLLVDSKCVLLWMLSRIKEKSEIIQVPVFKCIKCLKWRPITKILSHLKQHTTTCLHMTYTSVESHVIRFFPSWVKLTRDLTAESSFGSRRSLSPLPTPLSSLLMVHTVSGALWIHCFSPCEEVVQNHTGLDNVHILNLLTLHWDAESFLSYAC